MSKFLTRVTAIVTLAAVSTLSLGDDRLAGGEAARKLIEQWTDEELASIDVKKVIEGFSAVLNNKTLLDKQKRLNQEKNAEQNTRAMGENYYLNEIAMYPLYSRSNSGTLYSRIREPEDQTSPPPLMDDTVTIKISAKTHEGITYIEESEKETSSTLKDLPRGVAVAILEMRVGESRRVILPSWSMYGGRQYLNIPPYSTIIADITLLSITKKDSMTKH